MVGVEVVRLPTEIQDALLDLGFDAVEEDAGHQWWSKQLPDGRWIDMRITVEPNQ